MQTFIIALWTKIHGKSKKLPKHIGEFRNGGIRFEQVFARLYIQLQLDL